MTAAASIQIQLVTEPIAGDRVLEAVRSPRAGAVVLFLGTVREVTGERETSWLAYEAHLQMAQHQLEKLVRESCRRWPVVSAAVVHRLGQLALGDIAVAVAVSAPHRRESFAAAAWLMDAIKQDVPIWKQEHYRDGTVEWVHPGQAVSQRGTETRGEGVP